MVKECFFVKQKTAYEMRISDWSSDVCSSDLRVNSPLIEAGRLKVRIRYPYPTAQFLDEANYYAHHDRHHTAIVDGDPTHGQTAGALEIGRASCRERVCQYV